MKFGLIDAITELTRGERIVAVKAVSLAEEYLEDHFPTFPVFPGVLMLQALVESATWLVRNALDFSPNVILLREARSITYKTFVRPGQLLRLEVTCRRLSRSDSDFDGIGYCDGAEAVKGRFSLRHFWAADHEWCRPMANERVVEDARAKFALLCRDVAGSQGSGPECRSQRSMN